jgi:hypothetical protein
MFNPLSEYRLGDLIKGYTEKKYNLYTPDYTPDLKCIAKNGTSLLVVNIYQEQKKIMNTKL